MNFEFFVALRYIFALRKQSFIGVISLFAVCGVALGVAALIVVIGVMNGFTKDLRDKILGVNAHVIVSAFTGGIRDYQKVADICRNVHGVTGVTPFVYSEVMLSASGGVKERWMAFGHFDLADDEARAAAPLLPRSSG